MSYDPIAGSDQALLITEQLLVFATIVGSVGALPSFIEFMTERRKRKERIDLSLEDEPVESLRPRLAGMDDIEDVDLGAAKRRLGPAFPHGEDHSRHRRESLRRPNFRRLTSSRRGRV